MALLVCAAEPAAAQVANGFDLSGALVPAHEIRRGGPPRDGIPALTDPVREPAGLADGWLEDEDRVIGLALDGAAVAYPIRILNWHEVVNDRVGETPVVVTYCPLCGSGVAFDARLGGRRMLFGVSGLLYNSDLLMYDRLTESLFSQLLFRAITGPLRGTELTTIPARTTTWAAWKLLHPGTEVLSRAQPYGRDYGTDPYARYRRAGGTMFPVRGQDRSRGTKERAYLILAGRSRLLVPDEVLQEVAAGATARVAAPGGLVLEYDPEARRLLARTASPSAPTVIPGYWFALTAFHPEARHLQVEDLHRVAPPPESAIR